MSVIPHALLFFGKFDSGKTRSVRRMVHMNMRSNPELSYTVIGNDRNSQYYFDEEYARKDAVVRNNKGHLQIVTDADIIVIPEMRHYVDAALLNAALKTGKRVYAEMYGASTQRANDTLAHWNKEYSDSMMNRESNDYILDLYAREIHSVKIENTNDELPDFTFPNIEDEIVFVPCIFHRTPEDFKKPVNHIDFRQGHFEHVGLENSGINVILGDKIEVLDKILVGLLKELLDDGTYSSYAVYHDGLGEYHDKEILHDFNKSLPDRGMKEKNITAYFKDGDIYAAETDADVIIVANGNSHAAMEYLRVSHATGKPIFVGMDACNAKNAEYWLHFTEMGSKVLNSFKYLDVNCKDFKEANDTLPVVNDPKNTWVTDSIKTYGVFDYDEASQNATVKWL